MLSTPGQSHQTFNARAGGTPSRRTSVLVEHESTPENPPYLCGTGLGSLLVTPLTPWSAVTQQGTLRLPITRASKCTEQAGPKASSAACETRLAKLLLPSCTTGFARACSVPRVLASSVVALNKRPCSSLCCTPDAELQQNCTSQHEIMASCLSSQGQTGPYHQSLPQPSDVGEPMGQLITISASWCRHQRQRDAASQIFRDSLCPSLAKDTACSCLQYAGMHFICTMIQARAATSPAGTGTSCLQVGGHHVGSEIIFPIVHDDVGLQGQKVVAD